MHRDDAYGNLALPKILRELGLMGRDAALATELTYGTLRMTGTLDAIIAKVAGRPVDRVDPPARDALRLGAYQLLYTRVPRHAATATTVDLVRSLVPGAAGFANAVLRAIGERDLAAWLAELAPPFEADPAGHLALVHSHPAWIVRAFADALGGADDATVMALVAEELAANNSAAKVTLCARPGLLTRDELVAEAGGVPGRFGPYAVTLPGGSPGDLRSIATGRAHVQDEGSQLVAVAVALAGLEGPDTRWLDLCAGPGGKAGLLGALAATRGASVTAVEVAAHRARMVAAAVRGLPVEVVTTDGRGVGDDPALPEAAFDRVIVDAPCTGLGALRRRPEARWRRQPSDLAELTRLQRELLAAGLRATRPGGIVGYVTCSPHLAETRATVTAATRRSGVEASPIDARAVLPEGMPDLGPGPDARLWPGRHGTDGMYLSLLRRVS